MIFKNEGEGDAHFTDCNKGKRNCEQEHKII